MTVLAYSTALGALTVVCEVRLDSRSREPTSNCEECTAIAASLPVN